MGACQGAAGNEMPYAPKHRVYVTWFANCVSSVCLCFSSCLSYDKHITERCAFVHVHVGQVSIARLLLC